MTASRERIEALSVVHDLLYVCAPTPLQYGAVAGFDRVEESYYEDLRSRFQSKRDRICAALSAASLPPICPEGSYYVLADVSAMGLGNSFEAAMKILQEKKVACVPGQAFFQSDQKDRYVRFCFAVEDQELDEACRRLAGKV